MVTCSVIGVVTCDGDGGWNASNTSMPEKASRRNITSQKQKPLKLATTRRN